MKRSLQLSAILALVLVEIIWFIWPSLNLTLPASPETIAALHEYDKDPSETKKAKWRDQIHRDVLHNVHHHEVLFGLMILGDTVVLYYWWKFTFKKEKPVPNKSEDGMA
jgi:hypothetical protein